MDKNLVVAKVMTKLSGNRIDGDEVNLDNIPEKYKKNHGLGKDIASAYVDDTDNTITILCEDVFVPYVTGIKILSVKPYDEDYIQIMFEATAAEIKEILKLEKREDEEDE